MDPITLPLVAHRLYGYGYRHPGTAWERVTRTGGDLRVLTPTDKPVERPHLALTPGRATYRGEGTTQTIDQIRDLFDGAQRDPATGTASINGIWRQADIRFQLMAIIDHPINSGHAVLMENDLVARYAARLNWRGVVNFYVAHELESARGLASFSLWPDDPSKRPAYALIEDWPRTYMLWETFVAVAAHELGHLLTLRHDERRDNLMMPWADNEATFLRPVQTTVARDHAMRYLPEARRLSVRHRGYRELYRDPRAEPLVLAEGGKEPWRRHRPGSAAK